MKKILSIDGGGIRGIIPALVLAEIEKRTGKPISNSFDLIGGTSTGGILALGLTKGDEDGNPEFSARRLAGIYEKRGKEMFSRSLWKGVSSVDGIMDEKYSSDGIEQVLKDVFENEPISTCLTNVLVTSYDIQNRTPVFLKSWKKDHRDVLMKHAARATSAAPTYFEPASVPIGSSIRALIDGGVFINSPSVSCFVEAKRLFPDENDFVLISLGTGELIRTINYSDAKDWGKAGWLLPLLSCMFDGVSDASHYQMETLLANNYYRLQINLESASDDMDNVTRGNIVNLKNEANRLMRTRKVEIEEVCDLL